jgi:8-oxo-dGTP pyrophosphatase MutT (NUDIX family)
VSAADPPARGPVAPARDAATVVLVRDRGPAGGPGVEVLLVERHPGHRFAPGAVAFPGGRLEEADLQPRAEVAIRGLTAGEAGRRLGLSSPPRALGFWLAGVRELFEEAGILLAEDGQGFPAHADPARWARLRALRQGRPAADQFLDTLEAEGLTIPGDRLAYFAHWITPEERPLRFDARFFLGVAPPGAEAEADGAEAVTARWLAPAEALADHAAGAIVLPFPTRTLLAELAGATDAETLRASVARREVRPIRPRVIRDGDRERVLMPGDAGYW